MSPAPNPYLNAMSTASLIAGTALVFDAKHSQKQLAVANETPIERVLRELASAHATLQGQEQLSLGSLE